MPMNATDQEIQTMRREGERQQLANQATQIAVLEQMWLALARELAAQGALNVEVLAQGLEGHAQRAPQHAVWYYGLLKAAQMLRQASSDPDSLVQ